METSPHLIILRLIIQGAIKNYEAKFGVSVFDSFIFPKMFFTKRAFDLVIDVPALHSCYQEFFLNSRYSLNTTFPAA